MKALSIGSVWSHGSRALAPRLSVHVLILAVLGIFAPAVVGILIREASVAGNQMMIGSLSGEAEVSRALVLLGQGIGYALQGASFFAVWRIALNGRQPEVAAIAYGIVMGLLVGALCVGANLVGDAGSRLLGSPETMYLALIVFFLPLVLVFALFFTVLAVIAAAGVVVLFVVIVVNYGSGGGVPTGIFEGAGGGFTFLALLLSAFTVWLSARLSCVTMLLAERGGFDLPAAIAESWRRTAAAQWAIVRQLALLGLGLASLIAAAAWMLGSGVGDVLPGGLVAASDGLTILLRLVVGVPLALLVVLVPLGISGALSDAEAQAEVFD